MKIPLILLIFYFLALGKPGLGQAPEFCYTETKCAPTTWGGTCSNGKQQSPVNLIYRRSDFINARLRDLYLSGGYFEAQEFYLKNTGHSVSAFLRQDLSSTLYLTGPLVGRSYVFSQVHFHWGSTNDLGSEHTHDGYRTPLEAHMVHYSSDYTSINDALKSNQPGAVAVFAIFFEMAYFDNPSINPIVRKLRDVIKTDDQASEGNLIMADFFYQRREIEFIQYNGSLTTPGCNEVVLWNLMLPPMPISANQLTHFRRIRDVMGNNLVNNFRPVQPMNGRHLHFSWTTVRR